MMQKELVNIDLFKLSNMWMGYMCNWLLQGNGAMSRVLA